MLRRSSINERDCPAFSDSSDGTSVRVKVHPKSSRDQLVDLNSERVRIKLTAPPVEGEANRALIRFFAKAMGVAKSDIEIVCGQRSRHKTIRIRGMSVRDVLRALSREKAS